MRREHFIAAAAQAGALASTPGVPCSYLTPFINHAIDSRRPALRRRGERGRCGGDRGRRANSAACPAVVMFQNSGLGNAVNPLTSLTYTFRIPVLLIVTWRGEPGGRRDEPQHELMGQITPQTARADGHPLGAVPGERGRDRAGTRPGLRASCRRERRPYALVMRKGSVADAQLDRAPAGGSGDGDEQPVAAAPGTGARAGRCSRRSGRLPRPRPAGGDHRLHRPRALRPAATGQPALHGGLHGLRGEPRRWVWPLARPERRVIAIDGDGAALMRLGALTTVGAERPPNLVHVLLDNGHARVHRRAGDRVARRGFLRARGGAPVIRAVCCDRGPPPSCCEAAAGRPVAGPALPPRADRCRACRRACRARRCRQPPLRERLRAGCGDRSHGRTAAGTGMQPGWQGGTARSC